MLRATFQMVVFMCKNFPSLTVHATSIFRLFLSFYFRAAPAAHGGSQARGPIGATAADLRQSSRQRRILNPLSEATFLVGFVSAAPCWELPGTPILIITLGITQILRHI